MIVLRLKRGGAKKNPCYRIVAAEQRMRRDGRNVEELGYYHPLSNPVQFKIDEDKVKRYIANGAKATETVASFLKKQGITAPVL